MNISARGRKYLFLGVMYMIPDQNHVHMHLIYAYLINMRIVYSILLNIIMCIPSFYVSLFVRKLYLLDIHAFHDNFLLINVR